MNITHIIEASATGTLSMAALLANAQAAKGHHVEVIYSNRSETPSDFKDNFNTKVILKNIQMSTAKEKLLSVFKIRRTLKESSPHQIIMHSSYAGFFGRISSIGLLPKSKFLYIPHCISFMRKDINKSTRLFFVIFEWIAALKNAEYIACSNSEKSFISATIPFRKCHLVENAINFNDAPSKLKHSKGNTSKTIITVGQIRVQKGPIQFSEIVKAVHNIDPTVKFVWVGDGDPVARQSLTAVGVEVVGWVPKIEVWKYLNESRLYLSTALWEGMPVSIIEASIAGLPVVASTCAGNVDVIEHDKTGWLFKSTDEAVQHIFTSLNNPEKSSTLAETAFSIARERFSVERYVRDMENIYHL